jgi:hypothetical protein
MTPASAATNHEGRLPMPRNGKERCSCVAKTGRRGIGCAILAVRVILMEGNRYVRS